MTVGAYPGNTHYYYSTWRCSPRIGYNVNHGHCPGHVNSSAWGWDIWGLTTSLVETAELGWTLGCSWDSLALDLSNFTSESSTVQKKYLCPWLMTEISPQPVKRKRRQPTDGQLSSPHSSTQELWSHQPFISYLRTTNNSAYMVNAGIYHVTN